MFRALKYFDRFRGWQLVSAAGVFGFAAALAGMKLIDALVSVTSLSVGLGALLGAMFGMCVAGSLSALSVRRKLSEQNRQFDAALNNMIQGLCMFDAQNRLMLWNERYRAMYDINPSRIWRAARSAICSTPASPPAPSRSIRFATTPNCATRSCAAAPSRSISNWPTAALSPSSISRPKAAAGWRP